MTATTIRVRLRVLLVLQLKASAIGTTTGRMVVYVSAFAGEH